MPKPSARAPIPQIEIIKKGGQWEVHWDYQEGPASLVLFNRAEYPAFFKVVVASTV
ncbi:hypothetical protein [Pseudomonas syringae]|uniref:hypothetical protein n=1 Tax=Pseudomonas syringae TaxID=317 RepID=UPI0003164974|nr:hypothetical protein [Pseudomonas syringae]MDG6385303.1 hypothetical protein [Pseudomonas syringae]